MPITRLPLPAALTAAASLLVLASCQPPTSAGGASSTPTVKARVADYNNRLGNSRAAAELGAAVGRYLYERVFYWEVAVVTTPAAGETSDPFDPATLQLSGAAVRQVRIVMATEAAPGIRAFQAGGQAHEQQVTEGVARLAATYFTHATSYEVDVYFGEEDLHATGTLTGGTYIYQVHDRQ